MNGVGNRKGNEQMMQQNKPQYRVPTMAEIAAVRNTNGLSVVSTFSGCGGSCLGFEMAGYRILWASEFIPAAQDVYRLNHEGTYLDTRDIRKVTPEEILKQIGKEVGELDVFEGSPPCASFSTAGNRESGWGKVKKYSDTKQRVDDLFFEYTRLLRGLMPKTFIAENVSGLVKGSAKGYFKMILEEMKLIGYNVEAQLLDAKWLGVPQSRQRIIFIGVRNDINKKPSYPHPLTYTYTVRDAIPESFIKRQVSAIHDTGGEWGTGDITDKPALTVTQCGAGQLKIKYNEPLQENLELYATGIEAKNLKEGEQSKKYFNLIRADRDKPSPTILQSHGSAGIAGVLHPTEIRKFTITELKRICGFPDDFKLTGNYAQQWERLGRSVPPVMMCAVANAMKRGIFDQT